MGNITVYSTPTCPWCKKVKEWLKEKKIEFKDIDVSENEDARNVMVEKSGQMGVPVIDANGTVIVGFDVDKLEKAIKS
jgi:glutaredoxin 3